MREILIQHLSEAVGRLLEQAGDTDPVPMFALETARNPEHGDFACNAAMVLAKRLRRPPREIGERLIAELGDAGGLVARAALAGPGFVNLWLDPTHWHTLLRRVLKEGSHFGHNDVGQGCKVQVEFVSANPTGPLTLGHARQAALGDSIARLLDASGYDVTREYYFNDGGRQMRVLGESVRARYLERRGLAAPPPESALLGEESDWVEEVDGLPVVFPRGGYQGEYIAWIAETVASEYGEQGIAEEGDDIFRRVAQEQIFAAIRKTLDVMRIHFDVYSTETSLYEDGKVEEVLKDLRAGGLVYDEGGAVWLRSTSFGLDRDRVLIKQTGESTYLLPDVAYHREKFRRGFDLVIDVQGADHIEQFPYVVAAATALGCPPGKIELVMHQFVTLTRDGKQVKQSTRRATYVTADELLAEVGADVLRFFMLQRRAEGHLDFDMDLATETDWTKNPAYYLQYGHARTFGIERIARERGVAMPTAEDVAATALTLPEEIEILKKVGEFPEVVRRAGAAREPHHVVYYLRDLAGLWNPYHQDRKRHRVVSDDAELTSARLGLVLAVRTVLANGLAMLGLTAPERM